MPRNAYQTTAVDADRGSENETDESVNGEGGHADQPGLNVVDAASLVNKPFGNWRIHERWTGLWRHVDKPAKFRLYPLG